MNFFRTLIFVSIWALGGCVVGSDPRDYNSIAPQVTIKYDQFKGIKWVEAPGILSNPSYYLRGAKGAGNNFVQLYVVASLPDWYFLRTGYILGDRRAHRLTQIDTDVSCSTYGCSHYESVGLKIPKSHYDRALTYGMSVQLSGKRSIEFNVPAQYFQAFDSVWSMQ